MLELAILGELDQPLHGYELRKRLARSLGPLRSLSFGSLYPALHRLADQELIEVVDGPDGDGESQVTSSEKKTLKRRARNNRQVTYKITPAGSIYLYGSLSEASVDDESLPFTVGLMSRATPATRLTLLKQRQAQVLERKKASEAARLSPDFWVSSRGEFDTQQADAELSWIERLIQSESEWDDGNSAPSSSPA